MTKPKKYTSPINCVCGKRFLPPSGPVDADLLIIGEFPGKDEMRYGRPFCGPSGNVLQAEIARLGLDWEKIRVTNISGHMDPGEACFQFGIECAVHEAKGRKAILLLGSETSKTFLGKNVTAISGLPVKSKFFNAALIRATVNPANVLQGVVGDFRLALSLFVKEYKKVKR